MYAVAGRKKEKDRRRTPKSIYVACTAFVTAAGILTAAFGGGYLGNIALVSAGTLLPEGSSALLHSETPTAEPPPVTEAVQTQAGASEQDTATDTSTEEALNYTPDDIQALMDAEQAEIDALPVSGKIDEQTYTVNNATEVFGSVWAQNKTYEHELDLEKVLNEPVDLTITDKSKPHILIFHTHTTESYMLLDRDTYSDAYITRSDDPKRNMVRVGDEICDQLEKAGFAVIHDTNIYDSTYSGAYYRSEDQIDKYMEQYPEIQVILDIHRDAIKQSDGTMVAPTAVIDGKKAAQIMIISGCQEKDITDFPDWEYNLRFAVQLQKYCQEMFPGLVRPLFFCAREYNMHKSRCSLLIEMGSDANTLDEAAYSGRMLGKALAALLENYVVKE
ncbi:MAG: stage II sporulation protein P [Clostridia bacterium]